MDEALFIKRTQIYSKEKNANSYFMSCGPLLYIDATRKGNISRYMNHSCDPNCETQKWTINDITRIGFFTLHPVLANEELVFDYKFKNYGLEMQVCYCGSGVKCRGFLQEKLFSKGNILLIKTENFNRKKKVASNFKSNFLIIQKFYFILNSTTAKINC